MENLPPDAAGSARRAPTMADVAREAQVSRATVSRVLSGAAEVSPRTRNRILGAIEALGYVPSMWAQHLAASTSRTIGLLIRNPRNPAYRLLQPEVQKTAEEFGLDLITVTPTFRRGQVQEAAALRRLMGMRVGGLLVATGRFRSRELAPFLSSVPVVSVGRAEKDAGVHGVGYDEEDNATQIAHAVYGHGHRRVAVVTPTAEVSLAENLRASTAARVLEQLGSRAIRDEVRREGLDGEGHSRLLALIRTQAITAIVFPSDHRMLDFVIHARKVGVEVPRDVSVIGVDGLLEGLSYMQLASLRIPVELVARRAVEVMAGLLEDRSGVDPQQELYPGRLRLAASLAQLPVDGEADGES